MIQLRFSFLLITALVGSSYLLSAQTVSRFDFNSTATILTASTGPNATSVNAVSVAPGGIAYLTSGCGNPVGLDLRVPGAVFDVNNIHIKARFRRGNSEGRGTFYERGGFEFGFNGRRLRADWRVSDGLGGFIDYSYNTSITVATADFHDYEFTYDNCSGAATFWVDGVPVESFDGPENQDLYWVGAGDGFYGTHIDNACNQTEGLDYVELGGNTLTCLEVLPVELGSFEASTKDQSVELSWTTLKEVNNDYFSVERSSDGIDFAEILQIPGVGNSQDAVSYTGIDAEPLSGLNFYRLKQIDLDGNFSYSQVLAVSFEEQGQGIDLTFWPNPATDNISLQLKGNKDMTTEVMMLDMQGQLHKKVSISSEASVLFVGDLPAGMYLLYIRDGVKVKTQRLLLQK